MSSFRTAVPIPKWCLDDLANVLRRVREDFGVEIELDITPLRPDENGLARQHAVVGSIHYDGPTGMDKGTILYFKPAMTGDEPPDVLQYHTRNGAFPHQSTSDQFYDEAQWESYRRLGEHAGRSVLGFLDKNIPDKKDFVDRLFLDARALWHPAPERLNENFLMMSERCADLERDLMTDGPRRLRAEFFSEAAELAAGRTPVAAKAPDLDEELNILAFLMRIIQIMEDVWIAGDFDQYWSHPLNEGWMNYFHRWAATPSFRRWWPVLAPIYGLGFREFAKARFSVGVTDPVARAGIERKIKAAELNLTDLTGNTAFFDSKVWQQFIQIHPAAAQTLPGKTILGYELQLLDYQGALETQQILVGFVLTDESAAEDPAKFDTRWLAGDFFVPASLHGGGIVSRMLEAVIHYYETTPPVTGPLVGKICGTLSVIFDEAGKRPRFMGAAARFQRVSEIAFYKSRGFDYQKHKDAQGATSLHLELPTGK